MSHRHAEDLCVGATAPAWTWGPVTLTDIVRYAGASGDFTPVHHDPAVVAALGLDRIFAMGMLTGGLLGRYVGDWLGHERVQRFAVRFVDKTWVGDLIGFSGHVTAVSDGILGADVVATAGDGRILARGTVEAAVAPAASCPVCAAPAVSRDG
jgi:3-hydroxybutyryl-CoA dehydratase